MSLFSTSSVVAVDALLVRDVDDQSALSANDGAAALGSANSESGRCWCAIRQPSSQTRRPQPADGRPYTPP
jgi:hypothetical protein